MFNNSNLKASHGKWQACAFHHDLCYVTGHVTGALHLCHVNGHVTRFYHLCHVTASLHLCHVTGFTIYVM